MKYRFEFRPYRRTFKHPLATSHGLWKLREGIILRLIDKTGRAGFGEIAPLKWFGSESFERALEFCGQLSSEISTDDVFAVPSELPACQFGFESAWEDVTSYLQASEFQVDQAISFSGLLPSGKAALDGWKTLWDKGYQTFKWKIGIAPLLEELKVFNDLAKALPSEAKLRLDANGGLNLQEAVEWLKACDAICGGGSRSDHGVDIEFLEQPLPASEFDQMLSLSNQYSTLLALDESVANLDQLKGCYQQGWRGIFVIKPAIAGSPKLLRHFCQQYKIDAVFSTVFETSIGKHFGLRLSAELSQNNRAAGFGVAHWFANDDFLSEPETSAFQPYKPCKPSPEELWTHLSNS
jgi:O-succinylbenzoate synthase